MRKIFIIILFGCYSQSLIAQNAFIYNVSNTKIVVPNLPDLYKVDEEFSKHYKTKNTENIATFTFEKNEIQNHIILYSNNRSSEFKTTLTTFQKLKDAYKGRPINPLANAKNEDLIPYFIKAKELIKMYYEGKDDLLLENANLIFNQIFEGKINIKESIKTNNVGIVYNTNNSILYEITNVIKIGEFECSFSQYSGNVFINSHIFGISAINDTFQNLDNQKNKNLIIQFIKEIEVLNK